MRQARTEYRYYDMDSERVFMFRMEGSKIKGCWMKRSSGLVDFIDGNSVFALKVYHEGDIIDEEFYNSFAVSRNRRLVMRSKKPAVTNATAVSFTLLK